MKISSRMFNALFGGLLLVFVLVGQAGAQTWTQLSPSGGPPAPRAHPAGTYDEATNRMTVFGGSGGDLSSVPTMLNDTWVLSNANGLGVGPATWTQLSPTGGPPSPRGLHSAVYDPTSNRMIMFGGSQSCGVQNNEVWVLEHSNGLGGTPNWIQLSPSGTPSALAFHKAVYDSITNRMIIFGGYAPDTSAVSVLSNANGLGGTPTWTQLTPGGGAIPARSTHSAVYDPATNKMIVFAGCCTGTPPPE